MTSTQEFFLTCLKDHLQNKPTIEIPQDINIDELYKLSKTHDVTGMLYHQMKKQLSNQKLFRQNYSATIYYYAGRNRCFRQLKNEFCKNGISFAEVKGQAIAPLYPVPVLRTMGDIDLLIHESDKTQIHEIMTQLKYECLSDANSRDWDYQNNTIEFEMHPMLIYPDEQVEKKEYIQFFNEFWPYVDGDGNLQKEFRLLYLFVHLRKHLLNHGAGVWQFMDIGVFTRAYRDQMDWQWIEQKLSVLQLTRFAEMTYTFIFRWFGLESPLPVVELSDELYKSSTVRILENGVFGFQSVDDNAAVLSYQVAKSGIFGKIRHFLGLVFPSYALMRTMKPYAFVDGYPILLPVAWLVRIVKILRQGNVQLTNNNQASSDRIEMINAWGMK